MVALAIGHHHPTLFPSDGELFKASRVRRGKARMAKVYVGNLAGSVTSVDLVALFARAGQVRGALAVSDKAGVCRGFGFVEMADAEDAVMAISLLNNTELNGQKIQIDRGSLGGAVANGAKHSARRKAPAASN